MAERPQHDASRIASVATSLFAHAAAKGGQEGLDREKVNNIIFELSGSSSYTKEKLEHRGDAEKWVAAARRKLDTFDGTKRSVAAHHLKKREAALEATRRAMDAAGTVCCVVDFDMFYAAVELRDRPELKDKPVAVGGPGMITTANYVARKWGVRSAMPGFIGQELCRRGPEFGMPRAELVFVRPDFEKYTAVSKVARAIFAEYDPHLACYSLDEAYLDLTLYLRARAVVGSHGEATKLLATPRPRKRKRGAGFGEPDDDDDDEADGDDEAEAPDGDEAEAPAVALPPLDLRDDAAGSLADAVLAEIRARVRAATGGLTLSGGLGPNFRLAKVAADVRKPDGQHRVACGRSGVLAFLRTLPCRKVGGVGRVLEQKLEDGLGVRTCGELLDRLPEVHALFSAKSRDFLQDVALGCGAAGGPEDDEDEDGLPKGLGNERTFRPISGLGPLLAKLEAIAAIVAARLEKRGMRAAKATLKLKTSAFHVTTRDARAPEGGPTRERYVQSAASLVALLAPLLRDEVAKADERGAPLELRLMGVRTSDFEVKVAPRAPGQRALEDAFAPSRSPPPSPKYRPPGGADVDAAVLAELPPDIADDLRAQMGRDAAVSRRSPPARAPPAKPAAARPSPAKRSIAAFFSKPAPRPPPPPPDARPPDPPPVDEGAVGRVVEMGFGRARAVAALAACRDDVERAVARLLGEAPG